MSCVKALGAAGPPFFLGVEWSSGSKGGIGM